MNNLNNWIEKNIKWILIIPSFLFVIFVVVYPLGYSLRLSLTEYNLLVDDSPEFVGLRNYFNIFASQSFRNSIIVTIKFTLGAVSLQFILGLFIAVVLNQKTYMTNLTRTICIIPLCTAPIATALIWRWMYHPRSGIINYLLGIIGLNDILFLSDPSIALISVIFVNVWNYTPFIALTLLAGITSISKELYEAAEIDGASSLQSFFHITLPILKPIIIAVVLIRSLDAFKHFDAIYMLTRGGPAEATKVMSLSIYDQSFSYFHLGYGNALSWIMIIILFLGAIIFLIMTSWRSEHN